MGNYTPEQIKAAISKWKSQLKKMDEPKDTSYAIKKVRFAPRTFVYGDGGESRLVTGQPEFYVVSMKYGVNDCWPTLTLSTDPPEKASIGFYGLKPNALYRIQFDKPMCNVQPAPGGNAFKAIDCAKTLISNYSHVMTLDPNAKLLQYFKSLPSVKCRSEDDVIELLNAAAVESIGRELTDDEKYTALDMLYDEYGEMNVADSGYEITPQHALTAIKP